MSERFTLCPTCYDPMIRDSRGVVMDRESRQWVDCPDCGGTTFSGDAMEFVQKEHELDNNYQDAIDANNRYFEGRT